ncbi:MAG: hypothetical protein AB8B69_26860 [Chitinophagales bacterium]
MLFSLLWQTTLWSQNSTVAPNSIGPASSLNIDTTPISASTGVVDEKPFLTKYEFYTALLNLLPIGWQLSERESNMIISRTEVTVQKLPLNNPPSDPILEEEVATQQYGKRTYELTLRFESYPKAQYLNSKDRFGTVNEQLERLESKYGVSDMKLDDGTGWYIAKTKDEKNRLVFYHIERSTLEEELKPVPELYVEDYAVHIEKPDYYKLFPRSAESQLLSIIQQIQTLLKS